MLIVATPLVVLAGITLAQRWFSADEITTFALVCATERMRPGMGDRISTGFGAPATESLAINPP